MVELRFVEGHMSGLQYTTNFLKEQPVKCCGAGKEIS